MQKNGTYSATYFIGEVQEQTRTATMVYVEKLFSKNYGFGKLLKEKKQKLQHKCGILPQVNSRVININQNIYHCQNFWCLVSQF